MRRDERAACRPVRGRVHALRGDRLDAEALWPSRLENSWAKCLLGGQGKGGPGSYPHRAAPPTSALRRAASAPGGPWPRLLLPSKIFFRSNARPFNFLSFFNHFFSRHIKTAAAVSIIHGHVLAGLIIYRHWVDYADERLARGWLGVFADGKDLGTACLCN